MARVKLPAIPPEMAPYRAQTAHLTPRVAGRMPPSTETMAELKKPEAGPSMRGEKALRGDSPHHRSALIRSKRSRGILGLCGAEHRSYCATHAIA